MFNDKEMKLWRMALHPNTNKGEIENAAIAIINSLRSRNYKYEDLTTAPMATATVDWGTTTLSFGKHRGMMLNEVDPSYLMWAHDWILNGDPGLQVKYGHIAIAINKYLGM